jgi:hypothetical protein
MAQPNDPVGEPSDDLRRPAAETPADRPTTSASTAPAAEEDVAFLQPPTAEEELPTYSDEPATAAYPATTARADEPAGGAHPADTRADETATAVHPASTARGEEDATAAYPASTTRADEQATAVHPASATDAQAAPAAPAEQQPVIAPAAETAPVPPKRASNRIVATAWVLLAAGLFQVLFFGINALVALVFGGAQAVVPQVQSIAGTVLAWLPVLLFFLFFELVVLLINRAGRVAYVFASLIVAIVVYVLTVLLFSVITRQGLGDTNTLAQTFLNWEFILVGLVAREVMLWTGLAIGARGIRVRRRNKEARRQYDAEVADARA